MLPESSFLITGVSLRMLATPPTPPHWQRLKQKMEPLRIPSQQRAAIWAATDCVSAHGQKHNKVEWMTKQAKDEWDKLEFKFHLFVTDRTQNTRALVTIH